MSNYQDNYFWVNLDYFNNNGSRKQAQLEQRSGRRYIEKTSEWLATVERFTLKNALLPLYDPNRTLTIRMTNKGTSASEELDLDFSNRVASDGYLYEYISYVEELRKIINDLRTALSVPSGSVSDVIWNNDTKKISIKTNKAFRDDFKIEFNQALFTDLSSLPFKNITPNGGFVEVELTGGNADVDEITISMSDKLEISPVNTIAITSQTIPLVFEQSGERGTSDSEPQNLSVITDFSIHSLNTLALQTYEFESGGNHRWHSLQQDEKFNIISLEFNWKDFNGETHPLFLNSGGSANVKLGFYKKQKAYITRSIHEQ